jgi:2-methylcitrate dehydratase PrpD
MSTGGDGPDVVSGLAGAVAATSWDRAPAAVRDRVVDLVADTVAVAALGSARPELRALATVHAATAPEGAATAVGSARGWPAATAALLDGAAVAADQLQDGHREARGHPASHVVPAVLALAAEHDAGGVETLSAVLAGYEAGVRVGRAMGGTPDGVHDIGTWGAVAAAAGVARLLAPGDAAAAQRALELAAAAVLLTDAGTVFTGTTGSHAFLGVSTQLGLSLGLAAVAGLAPAPGSLDRHLRRVAARAWAPTALAIDGGWSRFEVLGGYVKAHPTCAHLHGVNDAVADLVARGVRAADVDEVEVRVGAGAAAFADVADGELAARFSVPTSVAVALVTGCLDETTMDDATVTSAPVRALAERVRVVHDPVLDAGHPAGRPARVRVRLAGRGQLTAAADRPRGDADRAFGRAELADKALRLLTRRFGAAAAADVLAAVHALAEGGTARGLGAALRRAAGGAR